MRVAIVLLLAAGCNQILGVGDPTLASDDAGNQPDANPNAPDAGPSGPHHQYVANAMTIPANNAQATQCGHDLDGDGTVDNQLGSTFAALEAQSLDFQNALSTQIADGTILKLFDIQAASLTSAPSQVLQFYGVDGDSPPDPTDNFSGNETFVLPSTPPVEIAFGPIAGGHLDAGPGNFSLWIMGGSVFPLVDGYVDGTMSAGGIDNGVLAGALTQQTIDTNLIPALQQYFQTLVTRDCTNLASPPSCGCMNGSSGANTIQIFDTSPQDCQVTVSEVQNNGLIMSLLAPDVDTDGDGNADGLSVGVCFTAVGANFALP